MARRGARAQKYRRCSSAGRVRSMQSGRTLGTDVAAGSARQRLTHAVEKPAARGFAGIFAGEFANARIRALERLVLHQHRLHERIDRVRRASKTICNRAFSVRIAWGSFKPGEPVKQIVDQLAFLRGHASSRDRWRCYLGGAAIFASGVRKRDTVLGQHFGEIIGIKKGKFVLAQRRQGIERF